MCFGLTDLKTSFLRSIASLVWVILADHWRGDRPDLRDARDGERCAA
jgi:hypothetical protein